MSTVANPQGHSGSAEAFEDLDECLEGGPERISRVVVRDPVTGEFTQHEARSGVIHRTLAALPSAEERERRERESARDELELEGRRRRAESRVSVLRPRPSSRPPP